MQTNLQRARGAFADLLNALDDARQDVTEAGEDQIDVFVAHVEQLVRLFDATFAPEDGQRAADARLTPYEAMRAHLAEWAAQLKSEGR